MKPRPYPRQRWRRRQTATTTRLVRRVCRALCGRPTTLHDLHTALKFQCATLVRTIQRLVTRHELYAFGMSLDPNTHFYVWRSCGGNAQRPCEHAIIPPSPEALIESLARVVRERDAAPAELTKFVRKVRP